MDNIKAQDQEKEAIRSKILELTKEYFKKVHDKSHEAFIPNESRVPYAARVFDENENYIASNNVLRKSGEENDPFNNKKKKNVVRRILFRVESRLVGVLSPHPIVRHADHFG